MHFSIRPRLRVLIHLQASMHCVSGAAVDVNAANYEGLKSTLALVSP